MAGRSNMYHHWTAHFEKKGKFSARCEISLYEARVHNAVFHRLYQKIKPAMQRASIDHGP